MFYSSLGKAGECQHENMLYLLKGSDGGGGGGGGGEAAG